MTVNVRAHIKENKDLPTNKSFLFFCKDLNLTSRHVHTLAV